MPAAYDGTMNVVGEWV